MWAEKILKVCKERMAIRRSYAKEVADAGFDSASEALRLQQYYFDAIEREKMISVIVPVYNVEKYLDKCVQSVLAQTYRDFELILVDDGSPDKCPFMCDEYAKIDRRVRVIHKKMVGCLMQGMLVRK